MLTRTLEFDKRLSSDPSLCVCRATAYLYRWARGASERASESEASRRAAVLVSGPRSRGFRAHTCLARCASRSRLDCGKAPPTAAAAAATRSQRRAADSCRRWSEWITARERRGGCSPVGGPPPGRTSSSRGFRGFGFLDRGESWPTWRGLRWGSAFAVRE